MSKNFLDRLLKRKDQDQPASQRPRSPTLSDESLFYDLCKRVSAQTEAWKKGSLNRIRVHLVQESTIKQIEQDLSAIISILAKETRNNENVGECLQYVLQTTFLNDIAAACCSDRPKGVRGVWIEQFRRLFRSIKRPLLLHQQVLKSLNITMIYCLETSQVLDENEQLSLLRLASEVMKHLQMDSAQLALLFAPTKESSKAYDFPVFDVLARYVYHGGKPGQAARDALILCIELSSRDKDLESYLAHHSQFCDDMACQLSGTYSQLQTRLPSQQHIWKMRDGDVKSHLPEFRTHLTLLAFCNDVVSRCPNQVSDALIHSIELAFLRPVLIPSLHQSNDHSAQIAFTAYLAAALRHVTNSKLLKSYLCVILNSSFESKDTFDQLVLQMDQDEDIALPTLVLFSVLLNLNCEDVLLRMGVDALILGYHLKPEFRRFQSYAPQCFTPANVVKQTAARSILNIAGTDRLWEPKCSFGDSLNDARLCCSDRRSACMVWKSALTPPYSRQSLSTEPFNNSSTSRFSRLKNQVITKSSASSQASLKRDGLFLRILFRKIRSMLSNTVQMNLQLAGICIDLASFPIPALRDFLFDSDMPLSHDFPCLVSIFKDIRTDISSLQTQEPDLAAFVESQRYGHVTSVPASMKNLQSISEDTADSGVVTGSEAASDDYSQPMRIPNLVPVVDDDTESVISSMTISDRLHHDLQPSGPASKSPYDRLVQKHPKRKALRKAAARIVIYEEFVKDMAAVCAEQSLDSLLL